MPSRALEGVKTGSALEAALGAALGAALEAALEAAVAALGRDRRTILVGENGRER